MSVGSYLAGYTLSHDRLWWWKRFCQQHDANAHAFSHTHGNSHTDGIPHSLSQPYAHGCGQ